jgi:2-dehydropantoate 2-reductase
VLVVGAGAIGSVVGGGLTEAGVDVTLAEVDAEHLAAIRDSGLRLEGYPAARTVRVRAVPPAEIEGRFEVVFLAVKSQHTASALAGVPARLAADGYVVSLQNGINAPAIAAVVGEGRVVSTVIHLAADQLGPGRVVRHGVGEFVVDSAAAGRLLEKVAPVTVTDNILGWQWTKQIYGCFLVASALADEPNPEQLRDPAARAAHAALLSEGTRVALALGIRLEAMDMFDPLDFAQPDLPRAAAALDVMAAHSGKGKSGMWRDIRVKGRRSESDSITGAVVDAGHAVGVDTPVNRLVLEAIHEIEDGQREMGMGNFRALAALAPEWAALPGP